MAPAPQPHTRVTERCLPSPPHHRYRFRSFAAPLLSPSAPPPSLQQIPSAIQDLMVKNVKRYQRQVKRDGGNPDEYDIIPTTFVLPQVC